MFSVRVEPSPANLDAPGHVMYSAETYRVFHESDGNKLRIKLLSKVDGSEVQNEVTLENGDVAYVMNVHGVTIDVLRTQASKRRKS